MLGLDGGNRCSDRRRDSARYRLLEGRVHSARVSYDFREMDNGFRKLVYVCEPARIVKTRESRRSCSCFPFGNVEARRIYRLGSSHAVDELLQGGLDARGLPIACVALELVNGTGKALGFWWKGKESHSLKNEERKGERKRKEKEKKKKIVCGINGLWFRALSFEHEGNDSATNLSR